MLKGFAFAFLAAISHTSIDALRKTASQRLPTDVLVCLVMILDATASMTFVAGQGGFQHLRIYTNRTFVYTVFAAAVVRLLTAVMYQKALGIAPLSMTVPYLAFTPAFLLFTGFFMIGEEPSLQGVAGILVVTLGGFLLSFETNRRKDNGRKAMVWSTG